MLLLALFSCGQPAPEPEAEPISVRVASFNVSMYRDAAGALADDLTNTELLQGRYAAAILQQVRPDILLLNEVDTDDGTAIARFQENFLSVGQEGQEPLSLPYVYIPETNTGEHSGFDLDNDGTVSSTPGTRAYGGDAWGYGEYAGKYGMVVLSAYPIDEASVRTFRTLRWSEMPGNLLPTEWYDTDEAAAMRLSSKNHADVPITVGSATLHLLASHPTPPGFDGPEDRNGKRNFDEIRLWSEYLSADWMTDDQGTSGGLGEGSFVIAGDLNADPLDGGSMSGAIAQLLEHPRVAGDVVPTSAGGPEQAERQGGVNANHQTDPASDTSDFNDQDVGNLRIDYVLPSSDLQVRGSGVFWPTMDDPAFTWVGSFPFPVSDHRLVWVDLDLPQE